MKLSINIRTILALMLMCFSFSTAVVYSPDVNAKFEVPKKVVDQKDKTSIATMANKAVTFVLYAVVAASIVALAASLGAMLPFFGKTEEGKKYAKVSLGVMLGAALFEMGISEVLGWMGSTA